VAYPLGYEYQRAQSGQIGYALNSKDRLPISGDDLDMRSAMDAIFRKGAQEMLTTALEAEVADFIDRHRAELDDNGHRQVVRNGHMPSRKVMSGCGPIEVKQPRVRDRRGVSDPDAIAFSSKILPPYLRKSRNVEDLLPWLYLRGISTGDFQNALEGILGPGAAGLSATTITRLTSSWTKDYEDWNCRDLSQKNYVYLWADGIHFRIRLQDEKQCILVIMGATKDGKKELVAILDDFQESEQSWRELLLDLKARGLENPPRVAVGDGALGFWAALRKVFPTTQEQRCWVHKTANVLNKLPKSMQPKAKADIHEIWMAATKKEAEEAFDLFIEKYKAKYPKASKCLEKDRDVLLTFYDFPAEHWGHLRTTNPIESTFATIRLRHKRTKGSGSRKACLAMVFKLALCAERKWRKLNSAGLLLKLLAGNRFVDGIMEEKSAA